MVGRVSIFFSMRDYGGRSTKAFCSLDMTKCARIEVKRKLKRQGKEIWVGADRQVVNMILFLWLEQRKARLTKCELSNPWGTNSCTSATVQSGVTVSCRKPGVLALDPSHY